MSHYILLEKMKVENANTIAGMTYGFPAVTQFLGFMHGLSRKLKMNELEFNGCAIFCHDYKIDTYKRYRDNHFIQKKSSPSALFSNRSKAHETPPIIEEGKMDITVSVLLRCKGSFGNKSLQQIHKKNIQEQLFQTRLAGGSIFACKGIHFYTHDSDLYKVKRKILPGFVLMDGTKQLKAHIQNTTSQQPERELFELWTDFFTYKAKAVKHDGGAEFVASRKSKQEEVIWNALPKPAIGWFVPLMIGYKGISPVYSSNDVTNLRDQRYPFRFVESVYSIGEWKGAHRINSLEETIWQYKVENEWYLCQQKQIERDATEKNADITLLVDNFFNSI